MTGPRRCAERWQAAVAVALALCLCGPTAQAGSPLSVSGQVQNALTLTADDLHRLPASTVNVSFEAHNAQHAATFKGVLLWSVLGQAGVVDGPEKGAHLNHAIVARGHDGYAVTVAMGEVDPGFEGKAVLIAYERDGQALPDLQLVVPGDRKAGRMVHDLDRIEVR